MWTIPITKVTRLKEVPQKHEEKIYTEPEPNGGKMKIPILNLKGDKFKVSKTSEDQ